MRRERGWWEKHGEAVIVGGGILILSLLYHMTTSSPHSPASHLPSLPGWGVSPAPSHTILSPSGPTTHTWDEWKDLTDAVRSLPTAPDTALSSLLSSSSSSLLRSWSRWRRAYAEEKLTLLLDSFVLHAILRQEDPVAVVHIGPPRGWLLTQTVADALAMNAIQRGSKSHHVAIGWDDDVCDEVSHLADRIELVKDISFASTASTLDTFSDHNRPVIVILDMISREVGAGIHSRLSHVPLVFSILLEDHVAPGSLVAIPGFYWPGLPPPVEALYDARGVRSHVVEPDETYESVHDSGSAFEMVALTWTLKAVRSGSWEIVACTPWLRQYVEDHPEYITRPKEEAETETDAEADAEAEADVEVEHGREDLVDPPIRFAPDWHWHPDAGWIWLRRTDDGQR